MDFDSLLQSIQNSQPYQNASKWANKFGFDLPQSKLISPLPESDSFQNIMKIQQAQAAEPTPTPTPSAVPTPTLIPEAPANPYMDLIKQNFPPEEVNNASNIMFRESSFNPDTIHQNNDARGTKDFGLAQINDWWQRQNLEKQGLTPQDMLDPEKAVQYMSWLWEQQGWNPWSSSDALGLGE